MSIDINSRVIPGFKKMSKQRIFNMAVAHLAKTRIKSTRGISGNCQYAGSGCAASPLLAPDFITTADTYGTWRDMVAMNAVPANNADFIQKIQSCHDLPTAGDSFLHQWKNAMYTLARTYGLNTSTLDKVKE